MACTAERTSGWNALPFTVDFATKLHAVETFETSWNGQKETPGDREGFRGLSVSGSGTDAPPCGRLRNAESLAHVGDLRCPTVALAVSLDPIGHPILCGRLSRCLLLLAPPCLRLGCCRRLSATRREAVSQDDRGCELKPQRQAEQRRQLERLRMRPKHIGCRVLSGLRAKPHQLRAGLAHPLPGGFGVLFETLADELAPAVSWSLPERPPRQPSGSPSPR